MSKSVKLTRNEVADCIRRNGVKDCFRSSRFFEYWTAFGQRWRLTMSSRYNSYNVIKVEQLDEQGRRISFEEPKGDTEE